MKNRFFIYVLLGTIIAVAMSFSPGSLFILILTAGVVFLLYHFTDQTERNFLLSIFLSGLGVRVAFTLLAMSWSIYSGQMLNYAGAGSPDYFAPYIFSDSGYYTLRALFTSMYWQDIPLSQFTVKDIVNNIYGFSGFIYLLAAFFNIFGYSPIASRFINCFLGSLTAILVYSIVKTIFNQRPARLAAILTAFFPSMLLWSITNLKDTGMIFAVCLMLWSLVKFQKNKSIFYLIVTTLSVWFQFCMRSGYKTAYILFTLILVLAYIFYLSILNLSLKKRIIPLFVVFIIGSFSILFARDKIESTVKGAMQKTVIQHVGATNRKGIHYKLLPERFFRDSSISISLSTFLKMLGEGWFHIMFEPFPGRLQSRAMLVSFPQMLLWYFLIPFAALGIAISVRYKLAQSSFLIVYFLIITSALAVTGSNVGTIFRHRDIVTPIFLIFASVGLMNIFNRNFDLYLKR